MKTAIGLLRRREDVQSLIYRLKEVGVAEENIGVLTRNWTVLNFLGNDQKRVVTKDILWGGLVGIALYGVLGLLASICECTLFGYGLHIGYSTLVSFVVIGGVLGVIMGSFVGRGEVEQDTHLYTQGVHLGGAMMIVQVSDELASQAVNELHRVGAVGVKLYPELKKVPQEPPLTNYRQFPQGYRRLA